MITENEISQLVDEHLIGNTNATQQLKDNAIEYIVTLLESHSWIMCSGCHCELVIKNGNYYDSIDLANAMNWRQVGLNTYCLMCQLNNVDNCATRFLESVPEDSVIEDDSGCAWVRKDDEWHNMTDPEQEEIVFPVEVIHRAWRKDKRWNDIP